LAGKTRLKSAQDRTIRKETKVMVMKKMPERKLLLLMTLRPIVRRAAGLIVEISPACFIPRVRKTSPAESANTIIAIRTTVFINSSSESLPSLAGPFASLIVRPG
jgi:hypothetical protein